MIAIVFMLRGMQRYFFTSAGSVVGKTMLVLCLYTVGTASAQSVLNVSSVTELGSAMEKSNQQIISHSTLRCSS